MDADEQGTQSLLRAYAERSAPSAERRERAWAGISAGIASGAGGAGRGVWLKGTIGLGVVVGVGLASWAWTSGARAPDAPVVATPTEASAPSETAETAEIAEAAPYAEEEASPTAGQETPSAAGTSPIAAESRRPARRSAAVVASEPAAPSAPSGDLAEELAVMDEARAAVARNDASAALAALDRHAERFPHGSLASERDVVRVTALCMAGRDAEARVLAATAGARPAITRALSRCSQP